MLKLVSTCSLGLMIGCASADRHDPTPPNDDHVQSPTATPGASASSAAASSAAPPGPVAVQIVRGPLEGITVLFHDADGNVIGSTKTDAKGRATAPDALAPVQVTALLDGIPPLPGQSVPPYYKLVTWTGVARGDVLTAINPINGRANDDPVGSFDVALPGTYPNATAYTAPVGACYGEQDLSADGSTALTFDQPCWGTQNAVLVEAKDATGILAFAFQKNVASPGAGAPIALSPWMAPAQLTVDVTGASDPASVALDLFADVGGVMFRAPATTAGDSENYAATGNTPTFVVASGFADRYVAEASTAKGPGVGVRQIKKVVSAGATSVALDFDTDALPLMPDQNEDYSDPTRPVVSWTSGDLDGVDGGVVRIGWGQIIDLGGGPILLGGPGGGDWEIYVAPGTKTVKAPVLPAEAAAWLPSAGNTLSTVRYDDIDSLPTYTAYRQAIAGQAQVFPQSTVVRTTSPRTLSL